MIYAAILLGLLGSTHCVGMCGPIALALPAGNGFNAFFFHRLLYNSGRVITYTLLGTMLGLAGGVFNWLGWQKWLAMGLGTLMFVFAIFSFRLNYNYPVPALLTRALALLKSKLVQLFNHKGPLPALFTGVLNGFLPCGLVYLAMGTALASGNAIEGAFFMMLFGLATLPAMLMTSMVGRIAGRNLRTKLLRFSPVFIGVLAVVIFLRGYFIVVPQTEPGIGMKIQESICGSHGMKMISDH